MITEKGKEKYFNNNYGKSAKTVLNTLRNIDNLLEGKMDSNLEFDEQIKLASAAELVELSREVEAEEIVEDVLQTNPNSIEALINISVIKILKGEFQEAEEILYKVLELEPNNEIAIGNLNYIAEKGFVNA